MLAASYLLYGAWLDRFQQQHRDDVIADAAGVGGVAGIVGDCLLPAGVTLRAGRFARDEGPAGAVCHHRAARVGAQVVDTTLARRPGPSATRRRISRFSSGVITSGVERGRPDLAPVVSSVITGTLDTSELSEVLPPVQRSSGRSMWCARRENSHAPLREEAIRTTSSRRCLSAISVLQEDHRRLSGVLQVGGDVLQQHDLLPDLA